MARLRGNAALRELSAVAVEVRWCALLKKQLPWLSWQKPAGPIVSVSIAASLAAGGRGVLEIGDEAERAAGERRNGAAAAAHDGLRATWRGEARGVGDVQLIVANTELGTSAARSTFAKLERQRVFDALVSVSLLGSYLARTAPEPAGCVKKSAPSSSS